MTRKAEKRIGAVLAFLFTLLIAWAIWDGTLDFARDHDGINDPVPCRTLEDGTIGPKGCEE